MKINSLNDAVLMSIRPTRIGSREADFQIEVEGEAWNVYEVYISKQDILCLTDKGTATFLVDLYGDRALAELYDWEVEGTSEK